MMLRLLIIQVMTIATTNPNPLKKTTIVIIIIAILTTTIIMKIIIITWIQIIIVRI